jgi:hypothetical protein
MKTQDFFDGMKPCAGAGVDFQPEPYMYYSSQLTDVGPSAGGMRLCPMPLSVVSVHIPDTLLTDPSHSLTPLGMVPAIHASTLHRDLRGHLQ